MFRIYLFFWLLLCQISARIFYRWTMRYLYLFIISKFRNQNSIIDFSSWIWLNWSMKEYDFGLIAGNINAPGWSLFWIFYLPPCKVVPFRGNKKISAPIGWRCEYGWEFVRTKIGIILYCISSILHRFMALFFLIFEPYVHRSWVSHSNLECEMWINVVNVVSICSNCILINKKEIRLKL